MLTDAKCRSASCAPDKKRTRFTDASGLYLEISPAGSKRWFWKVYAEGKEKRLALGSYPNVSLTAARKARDTAKLQKSEGIVARRRSVISSWLAGALGMRSKK